jgi:hypothetical protein
MRYFAVVQFSHKTFIFVLETFQILCNTSVRLIRLFVVAGQAIPGVYVVVRILVVLAHFPVFHVKHFIVVRFTGSDHSSIV